MCSSDLFPSHDIMPTNTRNGAEAWYQFSNDISKAQKIEVYSQDKKIGEFNPTKQSAKKVLGDGQYFLFLTIYVFETFVDDAIDKIYQHTDTQLLFLKI